MKSNKSFKILIAFTLTSCMAANSFADTIEDPCAGPIALLNIVNRPSQSDSACVVKFKHMVVEMGYEYQRLTHSLGYQQNYPEAEFRLGLPLNNELVLLTPNYTHVTTPPTGGFSATTLGIKHEIGYNKYWLGAAEALVTLADGNAVFGSKGNGIAVNGIVAYTYNPQINVTFMFGVTSNTTPSAAGGQRFTSVNPDLILTYAITEKFNIYGEVYGQTKTGPGLGSGANFDGGVVYLLVPNMTVDAEIGRRIYGSLNGFNQYIGAGLAFMI